MLLTFPLKLEGCIFDGRLFFSVYNTKGVARLSFKTSTVSLSLLFVQRICLIFVYNFGTNTLVFGDSKSTLFFYLGTSNFFLRLSFLDLRLKCSYYVLSFFYDFLIIYIDII